MTLTNKQKFAKRGITAFFETEAKVTHCNPEEEDSFGREDVVEIAITRYPDPGDPYTFLRTNRTFFRSNFIASKMISSTPVLQLLNEREGTEDYAKLIDMWVTASNRNSVAMDTDLDETKFRRTHTYAIDIDMI